jgi:hypothetical protein
LTARAPKEVFTSKQKNYKEGYSKAFSFFQQEKKKTPAKRFEPGASSVREPL